MDQISEGICQRQIKVMGFAFLKLKTITPKPQTMSEVKIYKDLTGKKAKLAVIGLGYVGLPIALEFAKKISVIGFDTNEKRIEMMREGIDPSKELSHIDFQNCDIEFTSSPEVLR